MRRVLLGGLRETGYSKEALGRFMKSVFGVYLCVNVAGKCINEKSLVEAVQAGVYDDVIVKVEKWGIINDIKLAYELSSKAIKKLGGEIQINREFVLNKVYEYTYDFVKAITEFLPQYNQLGYIVIAFAQNYKDYLDMLIACKEAYEISEFLGAKEYEIGDAKMFGYPDQDRVFLNPPEVGKLPETLGGLLLGIIEIGFDVWKRVNLSEWYSVSKNPYYEYLEWVKEALGNYRANVHGVMRFDLVRSGSTTRLVYESSRHGTVQYLTKQYLWRLAPYLHLRYAAIRREESGWWHVTNREVADYL
ncbi:hypothetical protein [Pyrobaculum aerophilum]|uniref:hypothetical protein n=1 Tax=Pyrobaculum aerophilum TaxID=13773 RepID=UPI0011C06B16|nr:hypothetical protein [Pyrobaculum aerophilum]